MSRIFRITRGLNFSKTLDEIQRYLNDLSRSSGVDYEIDQAIRQILSDYGDSVSVDEKKKALYKFGRNDNIGTSLETVWQIGGDETYPTGNDIDIVVSDDASDTQEVVIEGHTLSGSDLTFVTQTATLNGTTPVSLATPLYRANRMYNNGSTDFAGTVTVEDNGTSVNLQTDGMNNQSLKCATSISSTDYWIVTGVTGSVKKTQSRTVDFNLEVREFGKVFRDRVPFSVGSGGGSFHLPMRPALIVPKNSDIRLRAVSSGTSTGVGGIIHGYLAKVI